MVSDNGKHEEQEVEKARTLIEIAFSQSDFMYFVLWLIYMVGCTAAGYAQSGTIMGLMGGLAVGCLTPFAIYLLVLFSP